MYLILFALIALFLASCGSKEYRDLKKVYTKYEKAIDKAKTCEELLIASEEFEKAEERLEDKDYSESQEMSDEEDDKISDLEDRIEEKAEKKAEDLCL